MEPQKPVIAKAIRRKKNKARDIPLPNSKLYYKDGLPSSSGGKELEPSSNSWVGKIPWRREWLPTPVFLPEKFHGQRNLAGCSPWDHKELDMTEQLT